MGLVILTPQYFDAFALLPYSPNGFRKIYFPRTFGFVLKSYLHLVFSVNNIKEPFYLYLMADKKTAVSEIQKILNDPNFQKTLGRIATDKGDSLKTANKEAGARLACQMQTR